MSGWIDYNITGDNFENRLIYPILDAFCVAFAEKSYAAGIPYAFPFPNNWRKKFQTKLNEILPYYVPFYEDTERVNVFREFLDDYGFLEDKTEEEIQTFLHDLCDTGILEVPLPSIFLSEYCRMIYSLLNIMTGIRYDRVIHCLFLRYHTDWYKGYDSGSYDTDIEFYKEFELIVGQYQMRYWTDGDIWHLFKSKIIYDHNNIRFVFSNPSYWVGAKFAYTIDIQFIGNDSYNKQISIQWYNHIPTLPYTNGYKKTEVDNKIFKFEQKIVYCDSSVPKLSIDTDVIFSGITLNEDDTLPPKLDAPFDIEYFSPSGYPPAPDQSGIAAEYCEQDMSGNWYRPPNHINGWKNFYPVYLYIYYNKWGFPIIYYYPEFEFHS